MNNVNVVPGFEVARDFRMRLSVGSAKVGKGLPGKDNAPAKRVVRTIAFPNRDEVRRVEFLHQDRKIQSRRSPADDVDFNHYTKLTAKSLTFQIPPRRQD